ncbi:MAG: PPOX class F420-dependent oxidoreductase [Anaerolineae bacterium]
MTETTHPIAFPNLDGHEFMNLTTFRKSGEPVVTTVWFAAHDGKLYITTRGGSGKAKRIRATQRVTVAPSTVRGDVLGEAVDGVGRVLPGDNTALAHNVLLQKYGEQMQAILDRDPGADRVYLEISPSV